MVMQYILVRADIGKRTIIAVALVCVCECASNETESGTYIVVNALCWNLLSFHFIHRPNYICFVLLFVASCCASHTRYYIHSQRSADVIMMMEYAAAKRYVITSYNNNKKNRIKLDLLPIAPRCIVKSIPNRRIKINRLSTDIANAHRVKKSRAE